MTTLTSDLDLAARWARKCYPSTPTEVVGDLVHINYGYREAVCIGVEYRPEGKVWYAGAAVWDASGGVEDDHDFAEGSLGTVLDKVCLFLMERAIRDDKLERLLDERPED